MKCPRESERGKVVFGVVLSQTSPLIMESFTAKLLKSVERERAMNRFHARAFLKNTYLTKGAAAEQSVTILRFLWH